MANIFISYNRQSKEITEALVNDIEALGHTAWHDQELSGGHVWWDQILAKVRGCDVFVFVLDPAALNSTACKREYAYAADLGKPILPILVSDGVSTNLLPPALARIQFVDYRKPDRQAALRLARAFTAVPSSKPLPDPLPLPPEAPTSYLGGLTQQVEMTSTLSYQQQSALLVDLRKGLRDPKTTDDTRALLERLRQRHDLFATIAEEIDDLVGSPMQAPSVRPRTGPSSAGTKKLALPDFMLAVSAVAGEMRAAFGPKGQNVVVRSNDGSVLRTKDGIAIAREFKPQEVLQSMAVQLVRDAAESTRKLTGDGAKSTIFLADTLISQAVLAIRAGADPMALKAGIQTASIALCGEVDASGNRKAGAIDNLKLKQKFSGKMILQIGTIVANNDKGIGEVIEAAMKRVGMDGVITVEESKTMETTLEIVEGMQFDRGYLSPSFITDPERMECVLENALILIHEKKISSMKDLLPLLEQVAKMGKPLLTIAEDVDGEALPTLVVNKERGTLQAAAVKAPGFGDRRKAMLEDIATLTGGKAITEDLRIKLENVKIEDLGKARTVTIDKDNTTIVGGHGKASEIESRIKRLREQIEITTGDYDREKLQERLAKLAGGVALIRVGAPSDSEMKRKKKVIGDAVRAVRCAVEEGVVAGGGGTLLRAGTALERLEVSGDERAGVSMVRVACKALLLQLAANSLKDGAEVIDEVLRNQSSEYGFDAAAGKCMNLVEAGIIEPASVPRLSLQNAVSTAIEVLSTRKFIAAVAGD
jgi:chaperonin GroEL